MLTEFLVRRNMEAFQKVTHDKYIYNFSSHHTVNTLQQYCEIQYFSAYTISGPPLFIISYYSSSQNKYTNFKESPSRAFSKERINSLS